MKKIIFCLFTLLILIITTGFSNLTTSITSLDDNFLFVKEESNESIMDLELDTEDYIELTQEQLDTATTTTEISGRIIEESITSIDDIYGSRDFPLALTTIAQIAVANNIEEFDINNLNEDLNSIDLSKPIELFDANNHHTFNAYNYIIKDIGINGYVIIATHTKAPLIKEIKTGVTLPESFLKTFYLSEGEFYQFDGSSYQTLNNIKVTIDDFNILIEERAKALSNLTMNLLNSIELDTISMLNNMAYLTNLTDDEYTVQKSYNGQDKNAYGYGGISNISNYLKDRYGGTVSYTSGKTLSMQNFTMNAFNSKNHCALTAITRVLMYYRAEGYTKIDKSRADVFKKVLAKAKKHGYTEKNGTPPTKINNIIKDILKDYGYKNSTSKGIYVWTFDKQVKKEIDAKRPVIMNIARGYYGSHSVTVNGYKNYKTTKTVSNGKQTKTHNMIAIYDGWTSGQRYIDYQAFAYDLISSGFGSFNTVVVKN